MTGEYKGKIGVIIITLALVCGIFIGCVTNVDKTTSTSTDYEYVTDVSGLFNYDQSRTYVDYDVNKNYNGYSEYVSNTSSTVTDTYTNTAINENWLTSMTFTGDIPYSPEYEIYFTGGYMMIDDNEITYKTSSIANPITYTNLDHITAVSDGLSIVLKDSTTIPITCDLSSIVYRTLGGYDGLGDGAKTLYQLSEGSTFYFKSTNTLYMIADNIATPITSSTSGITAYKDGYTGTVSGTVITDSLTVDYYTSTESITTYTNTPTSDIYKIGIVRSGSESSGTLDSDYMVDTDIYGSSGHIHIEMVDNPTYYLANITEYNSSGEVIATKTNFNVTTYGIKTMFYDDGRVKFVCSGAGSFSSQYYNASSVIVKGLVYGLSNTTIPTLSGTYYYTDSSTIYSFNNSVQNGVAGATSLGNGYTGSVGTSLVWSNVTSVPITTTTITTETKSNTQNTSQTEYEYGITQGKTVNTSTEYSMYVGDKHIIWNGADVDIITSSATDHITLSSAMNISNSTLTFTGTSSTYGSSHSYSITLSSPYAYSSPSGNTILTGSTVYRLTGTAYYKSSSTIYGYLNNNMTASIGGTLFEHGVYTKSVGTAYIWTDSLTITSDQYTVYDMTILTPTGNAGIDYTTTTQPNAYIIGSQSNSSTGSKTLKDNSYIAVTVPAGTYAPYYSVYHTYDDGTTPYTMTYCIHVKNAVTIQNYVASLDLPSSANTITLTFDSGQNLNNKIFFGSSTTFNRMPSFNTATTDKLITGYTQPYNQYTRTHVTGGAGTYVLTSPAQTSFTITYNITTSQITNLSWYGNVILNGSDYALFYNNTADTQGGAYLTYDYTYNSENVFISEGSGYDTTSQTSSIAYAYAYTTPTYLDVNKGIKVNVNAVNKVTRWDNGYDNGSVSIIFHADNNGTSYSNSLRLSSGDTITITRGTDAKTTVQINNNTAVNIGIWSNYILTISANTGVVSATPIDIFANYTTVVPIDYVTVIGMLTNNNDISYIDWGYTTSSWGFTVYKTSVFLNTYNAVMKDPSINIQSYFPDIEKPRLRLYSFALYGNTMTINGVTYYGGEDNELIKSTGKIYINDKLYNVQDMYVTFSNDHTYLTFVDDNDTIDLGTTINTAVSFGGYWYYTTGLYEGIESQTISYDWNMGHLGVTIEGLAVLTVALLIVGLIIAKRFLNTELTAVDYILIAGAVLFCLSLLGGIML